MHFFFFFFADCKTKEIVVYETCASETLDEDIKLLIETKVLTKKQCTGCLMRKIAHSPLQSRSEHDYILSTFTCLVF